MRHGGQILVDQLKIQGVDRVFCVPGESFLAALDGLYRSGVDVVNARQEGGATMMAEADGKLTGRPGVALVTRGPGATNASSGVHVAFQDSTPMVLFIGQVGADMKDREAFQEVDYRAMFGPLAKWVAEIDTPERIPEYVSHAFHVAMSGRPGPVVLSLPETMLSAHAATADVPPANPAIAAPSADAVAEAARLLAAADRPLIVVGGPGWSPEIAAGLKTFAETADIPVAVTLRCQDYFDSRSPQAVGDMGVAISPSLAKTVREADVVLVVGARLGEMTTQGYTLFNVPVPDQTLIHVYPSGDEIGRVYRPDLGIVSASGPFLSALAAAWPAGARGPAHWREAARAGFEAWRTPKETPGRVKLEQVVRHLAERLPDDAIITNGAGNYSAWVHRYYAFRSWRTQLAPTSGSMGYGLPAAIAAKLRYPERIAVCFAGDGCFQMTCQEFGTAAQTGAALVVIVCDNGMYGTIRMHQERNYPGRTSGTTLSNPDFAKLAESYGGFGAVVRDGADFPDAFEEAVRSARPAILHLHTDPEALSPALVLSEMAAG
ncbi:thiamine pyrophosphate-binding protein [Acuticoccus mangrovi]|uniref:Thiamine pyrophosphate-binding protein n=1 Tax=Acuticoccus mangrovi TaxID=2796142 RepID=A0A934IIN0_9HYPH|nr:thiamine pyrophosphate-binding protein [Acuticoccus mangrovi]MBJ3775696.1 thiamine pyrophosphate-binding protein [Acuticoccus mangrovi]